MTGDTNMKKENTINQEQEEMVFAEAPAQVILMKKGTGRYCRRRCRRN